MITIYITSHLTDAIVNGFSYEKIAYIVTEKPEEVTEAIFSRLERGVTSLAAKGMYTKKDKKCFDGRHQEKPDGDLKGNRPAGGQPGLSDYERGG
jgi:hypothetical protein